MLHARAKIVLTLALLVPLFAAAGAAAQSWPDHPMGPAPGTSSGPGPLTSISDPPMDTFGVGAVQHDITQFTVEPVGADLLVEVFFNGPISPPTSGQPDALIGFIDFDTDQNAGTGIIDAAFFFCPLPAGIGVDFFLDLSPIGGAVVVDVNALTATPVMPTFSPTSFSLSIPLAALGGDDGIVDASAVVGTVPEPTDCAPDGGFITSGDGVPTAGAFALALLTLALLAGGYLSLRRRAA